MQTLWTRAAQVRGACRCPQCVPSAQGVSRRATGSATRRIPRYLTSSTLWYSGIFAAAATWDAGLKQQRREKWDKAIAEVRQELGQPVGNSQARTEALEKAQIVGDTELQEYDQVDEEPMPFDPFAEKDEEGGFNYTDGWTKAQWPTNTGAPLIAKHNAPNSIYAEDWQRDIVERLKWTPKKLAMVQTSADILLLELMKHLQQRGEIISEIDSIPSDFQPEFAYHLQNLHMQITYKQIRFKTLRRAHYDMSHYTRSQEPEKVRPIPADRYPICDYQEDAENRFRSTQRDLNSSLFHLFTRHRAEEISTSALIAKIIYNLRHSSAPPNIHIFNTLLLGFSRADEPLLVRDVARSLRRCHQRPNEITLATILNNCTKNDDAKHFTDWINLIRGKNSGLYLARPDVEITDARTERLVRHPKSPERTIQLPYHNPVVFGAIIAGVLKFNGFEAALQICQNMGQEGWGLCMAGLTPLLHNCMQRADWTSGLAVWKQIQALKAKSRRRRDGAWKSERIRMETFAVMLRLCLRCEQRGTFDEVWAAAVRSHSREGATGKLKELIKGVGSKKDRGDGVERSIIEAARNEREKDGSSDVERVRRREMSYWEFSEMEEPVGREEGMVTAAGSADAGASASLVESPSAEMVSTNFDETSEFPELSDRAHVEPHLVARNDTTEVAAEIQPADPQSQLRTQKPINAISRRERQQPFRTRISRDRPRVVQERQLREEELHGLLPASRELGEYEVRERPMTLRA